MTISNKMMLALVMTAVISVVCMVSPLLTSMELAGIRGKLARYEKNQEEMALSQDLQLQVANVWQFITDASLTKDKGVIEQEARPAYDSSQKIVALLLKDEKDPETRAKLVALQQKLPAMWKTGTEMFEAYGRSFEDGNKAMDSYDGACELVIKEAAEIAARNKAEGKAEMKRVSDTLAGLSRQVRAGGWCLAAMGFLVIAVMFYLRRSILAPLRRIVEEVSFLARGDLNRQFDAEGKDEVAQVGGMLNHLVAQLHQMIAEISGTAKEVADASHQLEGVAEGIATGSEEVAAQTATVATASEEMSATSADIACSCQKAADGARRASETAGDGAAVVQRTVTAMEHIAVKVRQSADAVESLGSRSDQIGAIVETIEDIADQTNLLALNASIEAARAGEQGRGFAVVADEVRALAERTSRATREIGEMIKNIQAETRQAVVVMNEGVAQVETGTKEAARSEDALTMILQQINDVTMQVNQIATAAEEQTATTSDISCNIGQITEVVQETSKGAGVSAAAAARLSASADVLQQMVQRFKL